MSSKTREATPAQWREAFRRANQTNAIEGIYPSAFGMQVQEWIIEGRLTVEDAVAVLVRHHTGCTQS